MSDTERFLARWLRRKREVADEPDSAATPASAPPDAPVAGVHDAMLASGQHTVPVIEDDRLVGLLTLDNISRYFMIHPSGAGRKGA